MSMFFRNEQNGMEYFNLFKCSSPERFLYICRILIYYILIVYRYIQITIKETTKVQYLL